MNNWCHYLLFIGILCLCLYQSIEGYTTIKLDNTKQHSSLLNIYGEPLHTCKTGTKNGSWDGSGYCSEKDKGVHQICFKVTDETKDFSLDTGQSNWSQKRVGNNHCMCLGAFALYKAKGKGTGKELQCKSIMNIALNERYINKWNTWNGNQLDNQIVAGVNEIMNQCYTVIVNLLYNFCVIQTLTLE